MSELIKRNISGFVALAVLAFVFYIGSIALFVSIVLAALLMIYELNRALKISRGVVGYLSVILIGISIYFDVKVEIFAAAICVLNVLCFVFAKSDIKKFSVTSLSIVYIAIPIYFALRILNLFGTETFLLSLIIPMATDIFAYATGRLIGKTPLVPKISPQKTVEGLLGGVFFSTVVSVLYLSYFLDLLNEGSLWSIVPYLMLLSMISQFGDFAASKIKREIGIKDYGDLIPGHGGLLDRFDSYLLVFPTFFVMLYSMKFGFFW